MFFIGQNLKHIHVTYSFIELLTFFWLTLVDTLCLELTYHHAKKIFYVNEYKLHRKPIMKYKQTFSFVSDTDVEKIGFFYVKLILFTNDFYKHIFRSSRLHMFFKISVLKNFAIIKIKKRPWHRCSCKKQPHDVNILIYFFTEHLSLATFVLWIL